MDASGPAVGVVERLGGHPARDLHLDLDDAADRARWLVAACLLAERGGEEAGRDAWRRLASAGLDAPERMERVYMEEISVYAMAQSSYTSPP